MEQKSLVGLLELLPILERLWESISMDLIVNLPKSKGCQIVMIIMDWFLRYVALITGTKTALLRRQPASSQRTCEIVGSATGNHEQPWSKVHQVVQVEALQVVGIRLELLQELAFPNRQSDREGECTLGDIFMALCELDTARLSQVDWCD